MKIKDDLRQIRERVTSKYINPDERTEIGKSNDIAYEFRREIFQDVLDKHDLSTAMHMLYEQQEDAGFIRDDLSQVECFRCHDNNNKGFFIGQFNPGRGNRAKGAGRIVPPTGSQTKNTPDASCFICADNVRWQQSGVQLYYQFSVNEREYNALCNPFPFMPVHMTIASVEHKPQSWHNADKSVAKENIRVIVEDLYDTTNKLEGFVGFYNGVGAGATIEQHLHFHFFNVPNGHKTFPIQQAYTLSEAGAGHDDGKGRRKSKLKLISNYPLVAYRIGSNKRDEVINKAIELVENWHTLTGDTSSANIAAIIEKNNVSIYFVPRSKLFSRSPGLSGIVGGLETLGEFVLSTERENQAINEQKIDFAYLWRILDSVKPPNSERLG